MTWWGWLLVGLGVVALAVVAVVLVFRRPISQLRQDRLLRRIGALPLRAKLSLVRRLFRDRRVPWWAKALLPALALYLAMPIDVIPDFIPVIGYLDDLVVLLLVATLLFRAVPRRVIEENVESLESGEGRGAGSTATAGEGRGR
jgi:uncharacterized membrane protein YkvA (DUF1232 family)